MGTRQFPKILASRDEGCRVVIIQNFRSGGGFNLLAVASTGAEVGRAIANSGQRHPGFCVEVTAVWPSPQKRPSPPKAREKFRLERGSPLILFHEPTDHVPDRCEVYWVGRREHEIQHARRRLEKLRCAAFAGIVRSIGSGEMERFDAFEQKRRNTIVTGR
ncbi:MAG: hypothetical protein AAGE01_14740 [Pseudomonadota bacterium]